MRMVWLLLTLGFAGMSVGAEERVLVYSTNPQYPPYHWADGNGFDGASLELLRLVLPPGVTARPVVLPWKRVLERAAAGDIDLVLSLRITPERSQYLKFTTHRAFPNPIVVFARADADWHFSSWDDLKGRPGGISAGDTFGGGFDEYWRAHLQVETADSMVENFRKLDGGRIQWFVTGRYLGQAYLTAHPPGHPIDALSPPVSTGDIHFGFSARSKWLDLLPVIDRRLDELDRAGTLERLLQKYVAGQQAAPTGRFPGE